MFRGPNSSERINYFDLENFPLSSSLNVSIISPAQTLQTPFFPTSFSAGFPQNVHVAMNISPN